MAISLELANGDHDGILDGQHAIATVTGAVGAATFQAHRFPVDYWPDCPVDPVALAANDLGSGQYELTMPDLWLWWVQVTDDDDSTANGPVWTWKSDWTIDENIAQGLHEILKLNKRAVEVRMALVEPGIEIKKVIYGIREEVDVAPSIEIVKSGVVSRWHTTAFKRSYQFRCDIACYADRSDDVTSDQELLGQMAGSVRDLLQLYEKWTLPCGLNIADAGVSEIAYSEALGPNGKVFSMAVMSWACTTEYAIPTALGR